MSPRYALTSNEAMKSDAAKAKVRKHVECDNPLTPVAENPGKFVCLHCLKAGWPVKAQG